MTLNLAPQLCEGGILIPKRVTIDACLTDVEKEFATSLSGEVEKACRNRVYLNRLFELSLTEIRRSENGKTGPFPPVVIKIPPDVTAGLNAMLTTTVTVFEGIVLDEYESGITYPAILHDLGIVQPGTRIEFCYSLDEEPAFKYRVVN
jgi:hypothetical protein